MTHVCKFGLRIYIAVQIRPLEEAYKFGDFFSSYLNESDFHAKPSVLLLGQYSTGKTTFVKHLLKRDYPGINIGPEPTTDRFVVVMDGMEERRTPGNTLIVQPDKPFQVMWLTNLCRITELCLFCALVAVVLKNLWCSHCVLPLPPMKKVLLMVTLMQEWQHTIFGDRINLLPSRWQCTLANWKANMIYM